MLNHLNLSYLSVKILLIQKLLGLMETLYWNKISVNLFTEIYEKCVLLKTFNFWGRSPPDSYQGFAPGPYWGASPITLNY